MPRRIESLFIAGPAGRLEALLEEPEHEAPVEAALVCHPHPQHGGTMHNKVVYRIARGLRRAGCVVLRFNYRGVNLSEGEYAEELGETEDARAALAELRARYPELPAMAAGFSFGSRVALRLAAQDVAADNMASQEQAIGRVIAAGFPTRIAERAFVGKVRAPKYFVQSTNDQYGPRADFEPFYESAPEPKQLDWVEAADHFFAGGLDELEAVVQRIGSTR
jgi:alpha/beta superfamily hydrolase